MRDVLHYHKDGNPESDDESRVVLDWIGHDHQVLELGCHSGSLARGLAGNGCETTGVDVNEQALAVAASHLKRSIAGDLERDETWRALHGERFDAVTLLHVLEHVCAPDEVLRRAGDHVTENGMIVIALPNLCNARDRLAILRGRFDYTDHGVMDRTHLRFFTQRTARALIAEAGLEITDYAAPLSISPLSELADHLPLLHRARFTLARRRPFQRWFSNGLTDVVMLFRCRVLR